MARIPPRPDGYAAVPRVLPSAYSDHVRSLRPRPRGSSRRRSARSRATDAVLGDGATAADRGHAPRPPAGGSAGAGRRGALVGVGPRATGGAILIFLAARYERRVRQLRAAF